VIIEITDDGNGAWNLTAKAERDAWPPLYMAYGRSPWAIKALVHGILADHDGPDVTAIDQTPRSEWTCGPECPKEA
jgi:hypothetical protein